MKYVVSSYNHDLSWLTDYTNDFVVYDRSDKQLPFSGAIVVPNIGSDIYDKLTYIIDNYDNLPDVAVYTKANIFKYITKEEWDKICNNTTYTPIFTKHHKETWKDLSASRQISIDQIQAFVDDEEIREIYYRLNMIDINDPAPKVKRFSFYDEDGMYNELNIPAFINSHPLKGANIKLIDEIQELMGVKGKEYLQFAPGSNYILPKENILKHPKEFYEKLRSYIDWAVYPAECMIIERGLHNIWKP